MTPFREAVLNSIPDKVNLITQVPRAAASGSVLK